MFKFVLATSCGGKEASRGGGAGFSELFLGHRLYVRALKFAIKAGLALIRGHTEPSG